MAAIDWALISFIGSSSFNFSSPSKVLDTGCCSFVLFSVCKEREEKGSVGHRRTEQPLFVEVELHDRPNPVIHTHTHRQGPRHTDPVFFWSVVKEEKLDIFLHPKVGGGGR